ncbi:MAG: O-antigen ligase family protein, partial [Gemmatimonadaceae bacterium]
SAARETRLTSDPGAAPARGGSFVWPWEGVQWNAAFVGFCVYSVAIITYIAPVGQAGMILALAGLFVGRQRIRFPLPLFFFGCLFLVALATMPASRYPNVVQDEILNLGRIGLIFFVGLNVLAERTRLRFYLFLYLAAFALYPVRGAFFNQFIYDAALLGRIGWNNAFENPNDLAAYLFVPLGVTAGYLYTERHRYLRWAAFAGVALLPVVIFMTQSRGAILALASFGLLVLARQRKRLKLLAVVAVCAALIATLAPSSVWTRLKNLQTATTSGELRDAEDRGSAEQRFEIWKVAAEISKDYPLTGVGLGAYPYEHWRYARNTAQAFKPTARGQRDAHSTYLTILAETGVFGLLAFLAIVLSVYTFAQGARRAVRGVDPARERQIFFVQMAVVALAVAGIFGSWGSAALTYLALAVLYGMSQVALDAALTRSGSPAPLRGSPAPTRASRGVRRLAAP